MAKDIADLRRDRKAAADKMKDSADAISTLETTGAAADAAEMVAALADFETAQAAFETADAAVKRAEAVERAQAESAAAGGDEGNSAVPGGSALAARAKTPGQEGIEAGFMVQALTMAKGDRDKAVAILERDGHSGVAAALSGASESAGGVTIPRAQGSEIIQLLKPRVAVRASGARTVPMPAGELRNARQNGGATAGYVGENAPAVETEPTFDKVDQSFKKLTALVPIGNSLLRHASPALAMLVRDDLRDAMALKEDIAFLRFDGTGGVPKGLKSWAGHWLATAGNTAEQAEAVVRGVVSRVEDSNVPMAAPGWVMRASAKNFLAALRDPNGNLVFPSIDARGELKGFPIKVTSQIPDNLGVGGDETEIYFADFSEVMIGDAMAITIASSTEAAFVNAAGDTISAFQNDLTLMRAVSEHDLAPAHDVAVGGFNAAGWSL